VAVATFLISTVQVFVCVQSTIYKIKSPLLLQGLISQVLHFKVKVVHYFHRSYTL